ncbi:6978_t:CDS:2, partial [Funneliformis mosseae]
PVDADLQFYLQPNSLEYGRKTGVTILKSNGASDPEVMALSRHKTIKGLAAYERPCEVLQEINNQLNQPKNFTLALSFYQESQKIHQDNQNNNFVEHNSSVQQTSINE